MKIIKALLSFFLKIIILVSLCFAFAYAIVFPLWLWATKATKSYSIVIFSLFFVSILSLIVYRIVKGIKRKRET